MQASLVFVPNVTDNGSEAPVAQPADVLVRQKMDETWQFEAEGS